MTETSTKQKAGVQVGLPSLLFILFLGLKLAGIIQWSWWWVFAPLWVPVAAVLVILLCILLYTWIDTR